MAEDLELAHKKSSRHRAQIEASDKCGCFYCQKTFDPQKITDWVDNNDTALCPYCGIDSVIGNASGYAIEEVFLQKMHQYWFKRTFKF